MIVQALFWTVDGVRHCRVDTTNPATVEEMHRFFLRDFPENHPRLVTLDIEDDQATSPTLRPPRSEQPTNAVCGWHNDTTPDVLAEDEEPIPEEHCDQPAGNFFNCNVPGVRVCATHKCRCRQPREPMATLDESEAR